jgi:serine/threonine protein kinase/Tol biopolymer transport system component
MLLSAGTRVGPYEIIAPLGAGGMGEVYRARDTKLGRDVALKVLPAAFASDPERTARFQREAQVLASLNHPHIGAIYGLEDSGGICALVMELIEGPTLHDRIARGPISIDQALPIAREIAEALETAHERGIVHRDLKPANVKITPDGNVKVLDFGLAKAIEADSSSTDIQNSPTISRLATQAGIILGTAAYMSPEQAKAKPVDRRTDIWAFGCVLFEMLTGKRPFEGETVSDALAAVIRAEPDWSLLPVNTPRTIRNLVQRCLKKDSRQRLQAIGDARIALEETIAGVPCEADLPAPGPHRWHRALPWAIAASLVFVGALLVWLDLRVANFPARSIVSQISAPENSNFVLSGLAGGPPALSPDGKRLAFVAQNVDGNQLLWVRPLDAATAQPLAGTDGAAFPFWSPESRYVGFIAHGKLNRIDASGGPPLALCDAAVGRGAAWSSQGMILFSPAVNSPLFRVPASGGTPQPLTKLAADHIAHRWPQFLPDNNHFLYYIWSSIANKSGTYVGTLDGGEPKLLVQENSGALFVSPGSLLYVHQGTLMAQRFDATALRLIGEAAPLAEHVGVNGPLRCGQFTVSQNGLLAYSAANQSTSNRLLWFDRSGKQIGDAGAPGNYADARISPDGRRLAIAKIARNTSEVSLWIADLSRGIETRLTFDEAAGYATPVWSPDGRTITFSSNRNGALHLYQKPSDGSGDISPLVVDDNVEQFPSWSSDGRYLLFSRTGPQQGANFTIWALPSFGDRKEFVVVKGQFFVDEPELSPDGRWLAYRSAESGKPEVYVIPFGGGSGKWQVSTNGGAFPRWRRDGRELYFLGGDDKIMAAEISRQGVSLGIGKVSALFQVSRSVTIGAPYDVTADGKKFVVVTQAAPSTAQPLTLITNWPALLNKQ